SRHALGTTRTDRQSRHVPCIGRVRKDWQAHVPRVRYKHCLALVDEGGLPTLDLIALPVPGARDPGEVPLIFLIQPVNGALHHGDVWLSIDRILALRRSVELRAIQR